MFPQWGSGGLPAEAEPILKSHCPVNNWKHFRQKKCGILSQSEAEAFLKTLDGILPNWGHVGCPLKLNHFQKYKLSDKEF